MLQTDCIFVYQSMTYRKPNLSLAQLYRSSLVVKCFPFLTNASVITLIILLPLISIHDLAVEALGD